MDKLKPDKIIIYFNLLFNPKLVESELQQLKIPEKFVLVLSSPVNFIERDFAWEADVKDLAVYSASSELLDFCEVKLIGELAQTAQ